MWFSMQLEDWISQDEEMRPLTLRQHQLCEPPLVRMFQGSDAIISLAVNRRWPHFPPATTAGYTPSNDMSAVIPLDSNYKKSVSTALI